MSEPEEVHIPTLRDIVTPGSKTRPVVIPWVTERAPKTPPAPEASPEPQEAPPTPTPPPAIMDNPQEK